MNSSKNNQNRLYPSNDSIDSEFKKSSKWRQSLRQKYEKTRNFASSSVNKAQDKINLTISKKEKNKIKENNDQKTDSFERPLPSVGSSLETPRKSSRFYSGHVTQSGIFENEQFNLESGWDSTEEYGTPPLGPTPPSASVRPSASVGPGSSGFYRGRPTSQSSSQSSGLDADSIFQRAHRTHMESEVMTSPPPPPPLPLGPASTGLKSIQPGQFLSPELSRGPTPPTIRNSPISSRINYNTQVNRK
jgi:hypothetical protein